MKGGKTARKGRSAARHPAKAKNVLAPSPGPVPLPAEDGIAGEATAMEEDGEGQDEGSQERCGSFGEGRHILELLQKQQDLCAPRASRPKAPMKRFRLLDHTADVGLQAFGETIGEAFENAALGMFNIITDPGRVGAQQDFEVTVEGEDLKTLLHDWLDQLLILSQVNNILFSSFKVDLRRLEGRMSLTGLAMGSTRPR
jgi:SHS2 domain-containing protein